MDRRVYARMAELDHRHWWFVARRHILGGVARPCPPPRGLNSLLTALFAGQLQPIGRVPLPAGVLLLALARKPQTP